MKRLIFIIIGLLIIQGCASSYTMLRKGRYDDAIVKAVRKLKKNPSKTKEITTLKEAYSLANQFDNERIAFLRKSGQPDIWEEVFYRYNNMKYRQDIVKTLPVPVLQKINFSPVDYDNEIIEAKKKAAEYFYAHAVSLLDKNDKYLARQAYDELLKVKGYYANYKDVDQLIPKAYSMGLTSVLFKMNNVAPVVLPAGFEDDMLKISLKELNTQWVNYDTRETQNVRYDYTILLNLKVIDVSPERIKESSWIESKEVQDGYQYVYDNNGNVMKDTAGNDIKVPKYKTISCQLVEEQMNKSAIVTGVLDFIQNNTNQLLKTEPISVESTFNHVSLIAHGDVNALKVETQRNLNNRVPFPHDLDMIMMTNELLKNAAKNIVSSNRYLFK